MNAKGKNIVVVIISALLVVILSFSCYAAVIYNYTNQDDKIRIFRGGGGTHLVNIEATDRSISGTLRIVTGYSGVNRVAPSGFANCYNLKEFTYDVYSELRYIDEYAFENCYSLESIRFEGVESIGYAAFRNCRSLKSISINPYTLSACAFENSGLESVVFKYDSNFPLRLHTIGSKAFKNTNISTINIPEGIYTIEDEAFANCTSLSSAVVSDVCSIGSGVFAGCSNLTSIKILHKNTKISDESSIPSNTVIYGWVGSTAHQYAEKYSREFISLNSLNCKHSQAVDKEAISSSCSVQGYEAGKYCEACLTYVSGGTRLPLAGHDYTAWEKNNDGTHSRHCQDCTNANETKPCTYGNWENNGDNHKKTCTACGYAVTEAHTMGSWSKADNTNHKRSCACGAVETAAHAWPADWSDNGTNHHKVCPTCSAELTENHSFGAWSKVDDNNHTRTCGTCGKVDTVAHTYTNACDTTCNAEGCGHTRTIQHNYSTKWTNDKSGHWHACTVCGDKKDEAEHTPGAAATETTAQTCTVCQYVIKSALGHYHSMKKNEAVPATCTEDGKIEYYVCTGCGGMFKDAAGIYEIYRTADLIDAAKGHTEVIDKATAATCTETGLTEGKHCEVCNEVIVAQKTVEATGHSFETLEAEEATCEADGKTAGEKCSACGEVKVAQEPIPATGHTEVIDAAVEADCDTEGKTEGKHCEVCGKVIVAQETVPATGAHTFGDWVVATAATETAEGEEKRTCTACGTSETRAIDKLPSAPQGSDPADDSAKNNLLPIIIGAVAGVVVIAVVVVIIIKKKK